MSVLLPYGWKTDGINRWKIGPYSAFGKGVEKDIDENEYKHLLEVDSIDHSPVYGNIDVITEEENNFELLYKDQNDNPDYPNNLDLIDDFRNYIDSEPLYIYNVLESAPTGLTVYTEFGPIIFGDGTMYPLECPTIFIISKSGVFKTYVEDYTLENYDSISKDRLAIYPSNTLMSNKIVINSFPAYPAFEWEDGDILLISYVYFHHSDMLRDKKNYTVWSSTKGRVSSYVSIDVSPAGNVGLLQEVNNVEFVAPDINLPIGATECIIQAGIPDAFGNIKYKVLTSSNLPSIRSGESHVIKFDSISLRYLRIILMGSSVGNYMTVDINSTDPLLPPTGLTADDLYNITLIPYYVNADVIDVQNTLLTGNPISVGDIKHSNIGKIYVPQYNIYDIVERRHYTLSHFDLRIGTSFVYRGLPSSFLRSYTYTVSDINIDKIAIAETSVIPGADVYLPIKYDLVSRNSASDRYFRTIFKNIDTFKLFLVQITGNEVELTETYDYLIDTLTGNIDYQAGLNSGESLKAMYTFEIVKSSETETPEKYLNFIRAHSHLESINYSEVKVFLSGYFLDFVPNNDLHVYEFETNPTQLSDAAGAKSGLVELLDGSHIKQYFGISKSRWSLSGEKISDDMYNKFKEFEATMKPLGIVTDTLELRRMVIVPGSLKGQRRKTTADEQENITTSWSYSMDVQEV